MKRAFDIALSALALIAIGWLIVLLIVVVRLSSPGPGLFVQERVGRTRKNFVCYKLRTMYVETPSAATHHTSLSAVTGPGRLLRRFKVDELPQLWNVLKGDMSFVGPRPCLPIQRELIDERQKRGVFDLRPGITGLAQVQGIDMSQPERLAEMDATYKREQSFVFDLRLIAQTMMGRGIGDRIRC
ncbi:MAG: sugar transferase [Nitrobacter sp.]|uniref:sugar transferase n=1 Tax=Nitrobacter sp. TaxID=29420 RepID=UPI00387DFDCF